MTSTYQAREFITTQCTQPDAHPAKNVRRAGALNHLQGSGETLMVGTNATYGHAADLVTVEAIRAKLLGECHRYLHVYRTVQTLSTDGLAELVAEIVTEYTDHVTAERDALAEDLAWELNAARGGGRDA